MSVPLVSVCVPTRDRLRFLRKSLAGALAQTYSPYEVVISDNWSTDGTAEYCRELAETDPRVCYVRPDAPVGQFANHNRAFREARGSYVSFFHDDDLYRTTLLERFAGFLDAHPRVGIVSCDWDRIDEDDRPLAPQVHRVPEVSPGIDYIERTLRSGRSAIALPGSMIRREALPDRPFDEGGPLGFNDHVTWFRIAETWDVGHLDEHLWAYRQHAGAGSHKSVRAIVDDYTATFTSYVDEYRARNPRDADRARRWRAAIRRYRTWALFYEIAAAIPGGARVVRALARNAEIARRALRLD